jgi:hypothetical protein
MTRKLKANLSLFAVCLSLVCAGPAIASQNGGGKQNGGGGNAGGGGGGAVPPAPIPQIAGNYAGSVVSGAPVIEILSTMSLIEDAAGNLSGTVCTQACTPLISGKATASPFFPFGVFQFKAGDDQFSGIVEGTVTCTDGTSALWVAGSFQNRGETSTFSFTSCKQ